MFLGPNGVNGPATSFCKADNETYYQQGKAISHLLQTMVEVDVFVYGYFTGKDSNGARVWQESLLNEIKSIAEQRLVQKCSVDGEYVQEKKENIRRKSRMRRSEYRFPTVCHMSQICTLYFLCPHFCSFCLLSVSFFVEVSLSVVPKCQSTST